MDPEHGPWGPWQREPERAGVLVDFDGTLARIVDVPEHARPLPEVVEVLEALAARYRVVAVVSGRPVAFLAEHLASSGVVLSGLYGLESWIEGRVRRDPRAERWRAVVAEAADRGEAELAPDVRVERKGLSVTFHVRTAADQDAAVRDWAQEAARRWGLVVHGARRSYELRPPIDADKGTSVRSLAAGLRAVCFVGDDAGDLPAFRALDALAAEDPGVATVRVGVASDESPAELLVAADVVVDGPQAVLDLLAWLASPGLS